MGNAVWRYLSQTIRVGPPGVRRSSLRTTEFSQDFVYRSGHVLWMQAETEPLENFRDGLCVDFELQKSESLEETHDSTLQKTRYGAEKCGQRIFFHSLASAVDRYKMA